ncbi:MAG: histidine kinase [Ferruginibacter sp.]
MMPEISQKLKDRYFKLSGIPITALLVTFLYNIADPREKINWQFVDYLYLVLLAASLWFSNVKTHYLFRRNLYQIKSVHTRLITRYCITILLSYIVSLIFLLGWNQFLHAASFSYKTILSLQLITILISMLVASTYEIMYLSNERESDNVKIERTEKSKIQAELDSLRYQIDPHFIFNSLNTLSYLISQGPEGAKLFNDMLAKVYRYILIKKEKDLVLLKEEIEFGTNYFYLLKIRYQHGLNMKIEIKDIESESYLLPPLSIQILIENCIKHNYFTEKLPLNIFICVLKGHVTVSNNRNVKLFEMQSSRIGLKNLSERYKLITGGAIEITDTKEIFEVKLPILKS